MRITLATTLLTFIAAATVATRPAIAQQSPATVNDGPKFDLSIGYDRTQANAPPGICQCFGTNGGYAAGSFFFRQRFAIEAQVSGSVASNIGPLGQGLHLFTYMAGPKIVYPIGRFSPFVHMLVGGATGTDSYFPTGNSYETSASTFAFAPGGGIDLRLSHGITVRAVQAQYLRTTFPNGTTNVQNHLQIGAGITFRFGQHKLPNAPPAPPMPMPAPMPPPPPPPALEVSCTADATSIQAGQSVAVTGTVNRDHPGLNYSWTTSGGHLMGNGSRVSIDTTGLAPGNYTVTGRVTGDEDPNANPTCNVSFAVTAPPPPPPPPPPAPPQKLTQQEFHSHVLDIYFDLNKADIHPDALETIQKNADFIKSMPWLVVTIGGFADQRGSAQYNLILGRKRSQAVKDQLVKDGVPPNQVEVVTYGRDVQRCTEATEECYRQNRRASFQMRP